MSETEPKRKQQKLIFRKTAELDDSQLIQIYLHRGAGESPSHAKGKDGFGRLLPFRPC